MIKLNIKKEFDIIRGDSILINDNILDDNYKPILLKDFKMRCYIKEYKQLKSKDNLFILNEGIHLKKYDNYYSIILSPDITWKLKTTKINKPVIVGLTIFSRDMFFRKEIQYGLNVYDNIVSQLY